MKRFVFVFIAVICVVLANAQTDTANKGVHFILKVNPTLMATPFLESEIGATAEVNVGKFGFSAGYGYNVTTPVSTPPLYSPPGFSLSPSSGNTLRLGVYYFLPKNAFMSAQFFYRKWQPTTEYTYNNTGGSTDYALDPITGGGTGSDELAYESFTVNNTTLVISCFDILYGHQIRVRPENEGIHFLFEWFVGFGLRFNTAYNEQFGSIDGNSGFYIPHNSPVFYTNETGSADIKLGIQIGLSN